ncbi:hypothetical protein RSP795_20645 [Ralstonia solanacearum]|nr:hypothetical protein RSP795_20645 [Ralstonia solanacearum]OAI65362.1 hypothetical protein RSP597_20155 [Ralstonia solanacearum]
MLLYRGGWWLALSDPGVRLMPLVDQLVHQETEIGASLPPRRRRTRFRNPPMQNPQTRALAFLRLPPRA